MKRMVSVLTIIVMIASSATAFAVTIRNKHYELVLSDEWVYYRTASSGDDVYKNNKNNAEYSFIYTTVPDTLDINAWPSLVMDDLRAKYSDHPQYSEEPYTLLGMNTLLVQYQFGQEYVYYIPMFIDNYMYFAFYSIKKNTGTESDKNDFLQIANSIRLITAEGKIPDKPLEPKYTARPSATSTPRKSTSSSSRSSFTNKYGTPTTRCAYPGCSNYIASSGDTNSCTKHSNRCLQCGKYIDYDATYCMDCLTNALKGR